MCISALETCDIAIAAETGSMAKPAAISSARTKRTVRMRVNAKGKGRRGQLTAPCGTVSSLPVLAAVAGARVRLVGGACASRRRVRQRYGAELRQAARYGRGQR